MKIEKDRESELIKKYNQELALKEFAVQNKDNYYKGYFYGIHPTLGFQTKDEIREFDELLIQI